MEGETVTIGMVRNALRSFGAKEQEISNAQLYDALGLQVEAEKARLRTRINDMVRAGEVKKVKPGVYVYNFNHRPRESKAYPAIWRFVRKAKPGWCVSECALMVRVDYTHVLKYCAWLEDEGYLRRMGRNEKNAVTYCATPKADMAPETPYPPHRETDPFAKERVAAATITRLMLCADPYAPRTARTVVDACRVLLARFEKSGTESVTKNENANNMEEVC